MLKEKIKELAAKYQDEFINVRHYLHAHPEISYQEFETSKYVQQKLTEFNIPFEIKATTGVVGLIKGNNPESRVIALRADMDALPIDFIGTCHHSAFTKAKLSDRQAGMNVQTKNALRLRIF